MGEAQPTLQGLTRTAAAELTIDLRAIDRLETRYAVLADRGEAAFEDRTRMNRIAGRLLSLARDVIGLANKLRNWERRPPVTKAVNELINAFRTLPQPSARSGLELVYLGLLERLVTGAPAAPVITALAIEDFMARPALLESIATISSEEESGIEVSDIVRPVHAAAVLLTPPVPGGGGAALTQRLRQLERDDLLVHVHPVSVRESQYASTVLSEAQIELERELAEGKRVVDQLSLCASAVAEPLARVLQEARQIANERAPHSVKPQILTDWVRRAHRVGQQALDQVMTGLQAQARGLEPERAAAISTALEQHRFADALALTAGEPMPLPANNYRAIIGRSEAKGRFSNSAASMAAVKGEAASKLVNLWFRHGIRGDQRDFELRTNFANFVFESVARNRKDALLTPRKRGQLETLSISCGQLRDWLAITDHNPSFLPQLTAFSSIGIITPPTSPTDQAFVSRAAELVSRGTDSQILVLLAPRISTSVRDAFRQELRKRNWRGVTLIDDIDLFRLLNPGGVLPDLPLGLLELILEQQPMWGPMNPFEVLEGQHTKPEMYVGRRDEAERLAKTANYSRVFSGRRLGKSALLKHIGDTYHGRKSLPSNNVLRVIYAPIVGIEDDDQVVERIRQAFELQLQYAPALTSQVLRRPPAQR